MPHAPLSFPSLPCDTRSASCHLPRPWPPYHPLRPATCSQTCPPPPGPSILRRRISRRSFTARWCAYGPSPDARLLTRAAAHAFAGRLRAAVRDWASFLARSSPLARAAHRAVRLADRGGRGEERGRDALAIGWASSRHLFFHLGALIARDHLRL